MFVSDVALLIEEIKNKPILWDKSRSFGHDMGQKQKQNFNKVKKTTTWEQISKECGVTSKCELVFGAKQNKKLGCVSLIK